MPTALIENILNSPDMKGIDMAASAGTDRTSLPKGKRKHQETAAEKSSAHDTDDAPMSNQQAAKRTKVTSSPEEDPDVVFVSQESTSTATDPKDLFRSIATSLPKELQAELAGSSAGDLITQLAAAMAEKMAAQRVQEELLKREDELLAQKLQAQENERAASPLPKPKPAVKSRAAAKKSQPTSSSSSASSASPKSAKKQVHLNFSKQEPAPSSALPVAPPSDTAVPKKSAATTAKAEEDRRKREEEKAARAKKKEDDRLERERKKEEDRLERERKKEEERLERERKKEEERVRKEEEKQRRDEEKQERDRKKDEERRRKDEEKQKKDLEKLKKEDVKRKQLEAKERQKAQLASFFSVQKPKPKPAATASATSQASNETASVQETPTEPTVCDFDKTFFPYYKRTNVELHLPLEGQPRPSVGSVCKRMDDDFSGGESLASWLKSKRKPRGHELPYTAEAVVNIANSEGSTEDDICRALELLPLKHIQFFENIRPPYQGTFTKQRAGGIPRDNPYFTTGTGLNYEYDSDIEWTPEDEDGEDLDNMEDESDDNGPEEDEDMDDFVSSDEGETAAKPPRRRIVGPLNAFVSWNDGESDAGLYKTMEIDVLCYNDSFEGSIDPFKDYWTQSAQPAKTPVVSGGFLVPSGTAKSGIPASKLIPKTGMKSFLSRVQGAEDNKMLLVELLKKAFPQYSKEQIRNTLTEYAKRVSKSWAVDRDAWELYSK